MKSVKITELKKWAENCVKELQQGSNACYFHYLGPSNCKTGQMFLVIGWNDGFEEQSKSENPNADGEWRICAKLAYNCDDLQCDYQIDWEMPYDEESGEVDDTDSEYGSSSVSSLVNYWKKYYRA